MCIRSTLPLETDVSNTNKAKTEYFEQKMAIRFHSQTLIRHNFYDFVFRGQEEK